MSFMGYEKSSAMASRIADLPGTTVGNAAHLGGSY